MRRFFSFFLNKIPRPWLIRVSYWLRPVFVLLLKGTQYEDPIDGKTYKNLLPYGYGEGRKNVLAPGSMSLERHRLMELYLQRETNFYDEEQRVLHMAPEQSFIEKFKKAENVEYTTADLYSPIADVKADIRDLPFEENSFDVVIANHVLEHIPEDDIAMKELYRVMKKGGWGIVQVPMKVREQKTYEDSNITDPKERKEHFGQYDHVRWYGLDYFQRLKEAGFEVEQYVVNEHFTDEEIEKYALWRNEILPVVRK